MYAESFANQCLTLGIFKATTFRIDDLGSQLLLYLNVAQYSEITAKFALCGHYLYGPELAIGGTITVATAVAVTTIAVGGAVAVIDATAVLVAFVTAVLVAFVTAVAVAAASVSLAIGVKVATAVAVAAAIVSLTIGVKFATAVAVATTQREPHSSALG